MKAIQVMPAIATNNARTRARLENRQRLDMMEALLAAGYGYGIVKMSMVELKAEYDKCNAEKAEAYSLYLKRCQDSRQEVAELKDAIEALQANFNATMEALKAEMRAEIAALRQELDC